MQSVPHTTTTCQIADRVGAACRPRDADQCEQRERDQRDGCDVLPTENARDKSQRELARARRGEQQACKRADEGRLRHGEERRAERMIPGERCGGRGARLPRSMSRRYAKTPAMIAIAR